LTMEIPACYKQAAGLTKSLFQRFSKRFGIGFPNREFTFLKSIEYQETP
jgi:hypothetical protein